MSIVEPPPVEEQFHPEPAHHSPRKGLIKLGMFFAVLMLIAGGGTLFVRSASHGGGPSVPVTVEIPKGASTSQIAELLAAKKVIRTAWLFKIIARIDGRAGDLKPGTYRLRTGMSYKAVLTALATGPEIQIERLTVPEGFTIKEIIDAVRGKTLLSAAKLQDQINSGRYRLPIMPAGSKNLEGLLFPKTYDIREGMNEGQLLQSMLDQFSKETAGIDFKAAKAGLSPYQVIVMASLIEREAKVSQDRAKIAGVIFNRLGRHMRLQIDATVQYSHLVKYGGYKQRLTYADYDIVSPWNTYRIGGLPPSPIASPGLASIQAVLHPANIKAIYYVLCDPSGAHAFADTQEQFDRLKATCKSKQ